MEEEWEFNSQAICLAMSIIESYHAADQREVLRGELIGLGNKCLLERVHAFCNVDGTLHLVGTVHEGEFNQLIHVESVQVIDKIAHLAHRFIGENACFFHERYGIHERKSVLSHLLERLFTELLDDAPELCVLDFVCETEGQQDLCLLIGGDFTAVSLLLVPLSDVEDKLIDDRVVVFMIIVREGALEQ